MVNKELEYDILKYLKNEGATNSFKLAHTLNIKRDKLLIILRNLENQGAIKIIQGKAELLSYPREREKEKPKKPKVSKKIEVKEILKEELEKQKLEIGKLKSRIRELQQRPPKVITRTIVKSVKPKLKKISKPIKKHKPKKKAEKKPALKKVKRKSVKKKSVSRIKKSSRVLKKIKSLKIKVKTGLGSFKIKNFIKHLKRR